MQKLIAYFLLIVFTACSSKEGIDLNQVKWIHGSADCAQSSDKPIQVVSFNPTTWILRQNKCVNYEAPFMYLFVGTEKALLVDTGATLDSAIFPLRKEVDRIISLYEKETSRKLKLIIAHSHSHADHYSADDQFKTRPNTKSLVCERSK